MVRKISVILILCMLFLVAVPMTYAANPTYPKEYMPESYRGYQLEESKRNNSTYSSSESSNDNYIIDRGVFGCAYAIVLFPFKVCEAIMFGRYGVRGLGDYFRFDKIFLKEEPKY